MPERTADVRRVVAAVAQLRLDRPRVGVVGHPCPWRDDLVEVLVERLPGAEVAAYDDVPGAGAADLTVSLEVDAGRARLLVAEREWQTSGRRARGEPIVPGARWVTGRRDVPRPEPEPAPPGDLVLVPVSGVRAPRVVRLFWDHGGDVLWDDDNAYLGELEHLLPMPDDLRRRLQDWAARTRAADGAERAGERRRLARELGAALGPDFRVET